jgi:hypothetical protein
MTLKLEIGKDVEAGLLTQAQAHGLSVEAYAEQLLKAAAAPKRPHGRKSLAQLFAESPLKGLSLKFERDEDTGRSIAL